MAPSERPYQTVWTHYRHLLDLMAQLGLDTAPDKCKGPTTNIIWIEVVFDNQVQDCQQPLASILMEIVSPHHTPDGRLLHLGSPLRPKLL